MIWWFFLLSTVSAWEIAFIGASAPLCNVTTTACGCMKEMNLYPGCKVFSYGPGKWRVGLISGTEKDGQRLCGTPCEKEDPIPDASKCVSSQISAIFGQYSCGMWNGACYYYRILGTIESATRPDGECVIESKGAPEMFGCSTTPIQQYHVKLRSTNALASLSLEKLSSPLRTTYCASELPKLNAFTLHSSASLVQTGLPGGQTKPGFSPVAMTVKTSPLQPLAWQSGIDWISLGRSYQCPYAEERFRAVPYLSL